MVYINIEGLEVGTHKTVVKEPKVELGQALSDEMAYQGRRKAVTRERHFVSDRVIFVDNLPTSFDKNKFIELFIQFGEILDVKFLKHKTGEETVYGFVEFAQEENGKKAINELHWKVLEGRNIRVSRAKPPCKKVSETNLYVENVPIKWTNEMLTSYFSKICEITSACILTNRKNKESRGVGFVHCVSNDEAKKALEWIRGEESRKSGLGLLVKFAKIPRIKRRAQKGLEVKGETTQQGKSDQSLKDLKEVKPASDRESNDLSEVEQKSEKLQFRNNPRKVNIPTHLSQVCGWKGPTNPSVSDQRHRRNWIMRKNSERDRIIPNGRRKQRNRGTVNTYSLKADAYTHHFDNYAWKTPLFCPNNTPDQKAKHPDDHKIQWASADPRHMQPNRNYSFRGRSYKPYGSSRYKAGRHHQFSSTIKDMYENCSRRSNYTPHLMTPPMTFSNPMAYMSPRSSCSNSHAYPWSPRMTETQRVRSPLSSVSAMQVQSPMSNYDQSAGWPGQFVSNQRSLEEQRFVCTNNISYEQMVGWTNINEFRWPNPLYTAKHSHHSLPQSLHNEHCWSTTSSMSTTSCSGLTFFNAELPIRRDETWPGAIDCFPETKSLNLDHNKLHFPQTLSFESTSVDLQQPWYPTSTNGSELEFEKQFQELGNTLQLPSEETNTYSEQTGFTPHVNLMKLTSYTNRSSRGRGMSPRFGSLRPQTQFLQGSSSLLMNQLANPKPVASIHGHNQYRSTTHSSSLQNEDLIPTRV